MSRVQLPKLIMLGIDGGDPRLLTDYIAQRRLPHLNRLIETGTFCPLISTTPPTTFPAWTSILTGAPPGIHGVPDFTIKEKYGIRFVGAGHRRVRTIFEHIGDNLLTVGAAWFPAMYPPLQLNGYHISGWDSPVSHQGDASFVYPRSLHFELAKEFPNSHLRFSVVDEFEDTPDWYVNAKHSLLHSVNERTKMILWLLKNHPTDVAAFYFGETDTVAHHFYAFSDKHSPRSPKYVPRELETAIADVYMRVDKAIGEIQRLVGDVPIIIVSDHGVMGNSDISLYLNRFLHMNNLLHFSSSTTFGGGYLSRNRVRFIPKTWRRKLFHAFGGQFPSWYESRIRFGGIDFNRTIAFSEEIPYAPSIWINQAGREPNGQIRFRHRERILRIIENALSRFVYDDGTPVIQQMHRREELHCNALHLFPDLILELTPVNGYMPVCQNSKGLPGPPVGRLNTTELLGRKGTSMPGGHSPKGIFASNVRFAELAASSLQLHEVAQFIYRLADVWPPEETEMKLKTTKAVSNHSLRPYTPQEQRIVAGRLKRLGYLEE